MRVFNFKRVVHNDISPKDKWRCTVCGRVVAN